MFVHVKCQTKIDKYFGEEVENNGRIRDQQKFGVVWLLKLVSGSRVFYTTKHTVYYHSVYYLHLPGQLKPDYRGALSSQGASGPAPSSTSLQEKLSMS